MDYMRQGPSEDSGFASDTNPGIQLVERIYNYCAKLHPKTRVMVSGIRAKKGGQGRNRTSSASAHQLPSASILTLGVHADALLLAGVDFLVVGAKGVRVPE